jgi:cytochrome b561
MFGLGWFMIGLPSSPLRLKLYLWHKSTGLLLLALALARLAWRCADRAPRPVPGAAWEDRLARAAHFTLYLLMILMPLAGWVIHSASGFAMRWFGWFRVPAIAPANKALQVAAESVHLALFWMLAGVLALHVGAALHHHFARRDDALRRMSPLPRA